MNLDRDCQIVFTIIIKCPNDWLGWPCFILSGDLQQHALIRALTPFHATTKGCQEPSLVVFFHLSLNNCFSSCNMFLFLFFLSFIMWTQIVECSILKFATYCFCVCGSFKTFWVLISAVHWMLSNYSYSDIPKDSRKVCSSCSLYSL